jgi:hypothetical protein
VTIIGSGLYVATFRDALGVTQLALDLDAETHKAALFTNALTPDFSGVTVGYGTAPYNANEVAGTGYTPGGSLLTTTTFVESGASTGILRFDADDVSWPVSTITGARGAFLYAASLAGKNGIALVNFGADYATSAGTFQIAWAAAGIFTLDLVP